MCSSQMSMCPNDGNCIYGPSTKQTANGSTKDDPEPLAATAVKVILFPDFGVGLKECKMTHMQGYPGRPSPDDRYLALRPNASAWKAIWSSMKELMK